MEKFVSFGMREEVIECDINITYKDFLGKIQETFNLKEDTFSVIGLTETNFDGMMTIKYHFRLIRSEKDLARERLNGKTMFKNIYNVQEAEDFFLVYGYIEDKNGDTALHIASSSGRLEIVKLILKKNFNNIHRVNKSGATPFHLACHTGNIDIVKLLLEQNFDNVFQTNNDDETPLYAATSNNHVKVVKLLLENNYDNAHQPNIYGDTPLLRAGAMNFVTMRRLLVEDYFGRRKENK